MELLTGAQHVEGESDDPTAPYPGAECCPCVSSSCWAGSGCWFGLGEPSGCSQHPGPGGRLAVRAAVTLEVCEGGTAPGQAPGEPSCSAVTRSSVTAQSSVTRPFGRKGPHLPTGAQPAGRPLTLVNPSPLSASHACQVCKWTGCDHDAARL